MPTLDGGLRVDTEGPGDWEVLRAITIDAVSCDESLAKRLGNLITDEEVTDDWQDFVVPDLEQGFSLDVLHVTSAIASALMNSKGGPGLMWIKSEEGFHWFSALNQARLALEEKYHFGPGGMIDPSTLSHETRSAFLRSQFYCAIQSLLLEHVLR